MKEISINTFSPTQPHDNQLTVLNDKSRFKLIRAGRKWRKTSLMVSWQMENAILCDKGLSYPLILPYQEQARESVWLDHVARILLEFDKKNFPYKKNEQALSITFPHNKARFKLLGANNEIALRSISNWGAFAGDEFDDWKSHIWYEIIRPNLLTHKAPAVIGGTPKGMKNMYRLAQEGVFKEFHFTSFDNPELDRGELEALIKEAKSKGEDYYRQEIMAEYVKPYGLVYKEWNLDNFVDFDYDENLPVHLTFDFGVNDPTAIIWIQPNGGETRVIDYYEASNADINHFIQVIKSKPYKTPEFCAGDIAGDSRELTTGKSPTKILQEAGYIIKTSSIPNIPAQIRQAHTRIPHLFVNHKAERFRDILLNYRYPAVREGLLNQSNEIPIHDEWCLTGDTQIRTLDGWHRIDSLVGKDFYVWGYSEKEKRLVPTKAKKCWKTFDKAETIRIGLDDGKELKCTKEHKVMLRDGSYREAGKLKVGDSLMPFYEWNTCKERHNVINLNDGSSGDEHRIVYSRLKGHLQDGLVIHHIDNNKNNNNPENLEQISIDDHCRITKPHLSTGSAIIKPTGIRKFEKSCIWCGNSFTGTWKSIYCSSKCSNQRRSAIKIDERRNKQPIKKCAWCNKDFHAYSRELTCSNECARLRTEKYNQDYQKNRIRVRKNNHKVTYVLKGNIEPVYDIEVPETHNFVANGVVVHNCHGARAFEYWCWNWSPPEQEIPKGKKKPGQEILDIINDKRKARDYLSWY